jgi:hypothetical protein
MTMPAVSAPDEPDERTPEAIDVPPRAETSSRRVRLVLAALVVLVAIAAALLIWGLTR